MYDDDILREIRAYREAYAARFNYDLGAMHRDLLARQAESGHPVVSFAEPRPGGPSPEAGPTDEAPANSASPYAGPRR